MQDLNPRSQVRSTDWLLALLAVGGTAVFLLVLGWVGADIDVWYGAGLVRALAERPLPPESLGHVPKLAHLAILAPAAALGSTPEYWLLVVGIASLIWIVWCHVRWARAAFVSTPRLVLALALAPLLWRATLDGGSVAWGWGCVLMALTSRAAGTRGAPAWLALGALFRPECVGVGLALGVRGRLAGNRGAWWMVATPLIAAALGTMAVDLLWSGSIGASSIAHSVFESVGLEQVRGRWGFADTGHPWLQLSLPLLIGAAIALTRRVVRVTGANEVHVPIDELMVAAVGFSVISIGNVATGGTLFVRFLLPWVSVVAALSVAIPWPATLWRRTALLSAAALCTMFGWRLVAPEFVGTYPTADALLVARRVARTTSPKIIVAMDAGARAVTLGSGARPWKTTPWILQSAEIPCQSQAIIVRGALLARLDSVALARCGPWRDFVVDSAQTQVGLRVLVAFRNGEPPR
ncbi:MAG: hypothetical protein ABI877_16755 [Gemmatimonadaceae bacterium]